MLTPKKSLQVTFDPPPTLTAAKAGVASNAPGPGVRSQKNNDSHFYYIMVHLRVGLVWHRALESFRTHLIQKGCTRFYSIVLSNCLGRLSFDSTAFNAKRDGWHFGRGVRVSPIYSYLH